MTVEIIPADLFLPNVDSDRATEVIATVMARAARFAPCLLLPDVDANTEQALKGVLVDVITRRYERVIGKKSITAGGRTESFEAPTGLFWPAEISELQALCAIGTAPAAASTPVYSFPDARPWPDGLDNC